MKRLYKGIEPIIAVVILVAVTLVIAIAVVGWIMGWWGAALGGVEDLRLLTATLKTDGEVNVTIYNAGTATAEIFQIEVVGVGINRASCKGGNNVVKPGDTISCTATVSGSYSTGARYTIVVYTKAGNRFSTIAIATASS